jgi:hypothetical protein
LPPKCVPEYVSGADLQCSSSSLLAKSLTCDVFVFPDYAFSHLKFGGNAQSITKNRWVHHTSFLWDYNVKNMDYLRIPKRVPEYRLVQFLSAHFSCSDFKQYLYIDMNNDVCHLVNCYKIVNGLKNTA